MRIHCPHDSLVSVTELKPHPKNRNAHPRDQIKRLAKILEYQGWRYPIKVSKLSGYITSGHGRLEAAKLLKLKEVPVSFQDYADEAQEYADLQSDNSIASWAELDLAGINADIVDLGPDFDLDLLGIKDFVLEPVEKLEPQCDEDEVPDALPEPKVVRGEVYILGKHRLMCGDSTAITDVERLMDGKKAEMVFTDPPYGVSYQSNMRAKSDKFQVIENDDIFLTEWIGILPVVSTGWVFVWTTWKVLGKWIEITAPIGDLTNLIIWDKGGGGIGDLEKTFSTDYEIALVFNRGSKITGKRIGSVWAIGKDQARDYIHPTQKPVALSEMAIENVTGPHQTILDLFGGSGSTLIGCEKTNRHARLMELDPHYCGVILDRWQKFTGKKAHREDGVTWDEIKAGVSDGQTA